MSEKFDTIVKRIGTLEATCSGIENENKCLKAEVSRLSQMVNQQQEEINNIQQYSRRDCVEISGIPQQMGEDMDGLVIEVGKLMGLDHDETDISTSHRLPQSKRSTSYSSKLCSSKDGSTSAVSHYPKIMVKFTRRNSKEAFHGNRKYLADKTTRGAHFRCNLEFLGGFRPTRDRLFVFDWTLNKQLQTAMYEKNGTVQHHVVVGRRF